MAQSLNYDADLIPVMEDGRDTITESIKKKKEVLTTIVEELKPTGLTRLITTAQALLDKCDVDSKNAEKNADGVNTLINITRKVTEAYN